MLLLLKDSKSEIDKWLRLKMPFNVFMIFFAEIKI